MLSSAAEERELLDDDEEDQDGAVDAQAQMPEVLKTLTQVLTTMSTSMASIEKTGSQRLQRDEVEPSPKSRKRSVELEQNDESDVGDSERLLQSTVCPTIADGINFLATLYEEGIGYSELNTARSALSAIIALPDSVSFGITQVCGVL